jgi:hypothetical protein
MVNHNHQESDKESKMTSILRSEGKTSIPSRPKAPANRNGYVALDVSGAPEVCCHPGVIGTRVGYAGGQQPDPTYYNWYV